MAAHVAGRKDVVFMLKNFEIFRGLTDAELEDIACIVQTVTFPRGAIIFNQGDVFSDFFIIESGQVEISVKDPFHERKILTILRNHDFFGEMGLFDRNAIRSATAKALQTTPSLERSTFFRNTWMPSQITQIFKTTWGACSF